MLNDAAPSHQLVRKLADLVKATTHVCEGLELRFTQNGGVERPLPPALEHESRHLLERQRVGELQRVEQPILISVESIELCSRLLFRHIESRSPS